MSLAILRLPAATPERFAPTDPRFITVFCLVLLTAACALASFVFACATPFAAFAVVAAALLTLPSALLVVTAAWIVNQAIGFGALHYPIDANAMAWGLAIGVAALAATAMAGLVLRLLPRIGDPLALSAALVAAFVSYEVVLFAFTPVLGGGGAFTAPIVARIGLLDLSWLIGLMAACAVVRVLAVRRQHALS